MNAKLPSTMTEIQITVPGGPEVLQPRSVPTPQPGPGELLIRGEAAGVNRPDVLQRAGNYPVPPGASPIPGLEVAGTIAAVGEGVHGFAIGDAVCGLTNGGGYAQYCVVPAGQVLAIPQGLTWQQAAAIPETFFTVWANLFDMVHASSSDTVLIHGGTSGIGTTALMLCREFGIRAFATAGNLEKCNAIRELGGDPINYRETSFVDSVLKQTDGRGVDVILDIMGGSYFNDNLAALALDGRLLIIGFLGGAVAKEVNLAAIARRRAHITGSTMRTRTAREKAAIANSLRTHVWPALTEGRCIPMIHAVFPLERAADAHRAMEAGQHIGKLVLEISHLGML